MSDCMVVRAQAVKMVEILTPRDLLPLRLRLAHPMTDEALFEFCRMNRELRVERTREGELIIMPPTGGETGRRNFNLTVAFGNWARKDATGIGFDSSTGFILPSGAERSPDVAWVRKARWDALTPEQRQRFVPLCPDFVIELRSRSDALPDLQAKMEEYIECGPEQGWLIDPERRQVHIYRSGGAVEVLDDPATVSAEPLLRGFVLPLGEV